MKAVIAQELSANSRPTHVPALSTTADNAGARRLLPSLVEVATRQLRLSSFHPIEPSAMCVPAQKPPGLGSPLALLAGGYLCRPQHGQSQGPSTANRAAWTFQIRSFLPYQS